MTAGAALLLDAETRLLAMERRLDRAEQLLNWASDSVMFHRAAAAKDGKPETLRKTRNLHDEIRRYFARGRP